MFGSTETPLAPVRHSRRADWAAGQAISYLMRQGVENPQCLSLAAGLVDATTLPVETVRRAAEIVLSDQAWGRHALQYGHTSGAERLRKSLLAHFAALEGRSVDDLGIELDQVILTNGSQQFLSLVAQVLLDPGDLCLVASPTYFVFLGTVAGVGAQSVCIETDESGMQPEALDAKLAELNAAGELNRVKLIYLVSDFENPSGYSLSAERRRQIVEIANKWSREQRIHILEDAAYRELRYDGDPSPSVRSCDATGESVIYAGTFSKSFSPGLRVGFGIAPNGLVEAICARKGNEDFGSAHLNQQIVATVLEEGWYVPHTNVVRMGYRTKRDALLAALDREFAGLDGVTWVRPDGGLYVWMSLPERIDTGFESSLFERASKIEQVMYVPGELCYGDESGTRPRHQMRLSFGVLDPHSLSEAVARLARAVRGVM
ncbi:MAG: PLP-dependent aminotransferase family protein [Planctomycetota bacterium]|nr:PLP-dependent aminotransferase family protein [Planctomycetaceae bacterium]MDQ3331225.1 PLP-dependent aminotransferase family protein [Planctomycetota bacterium]